MTLYRSGYYAKAALGWLVTGLVLGLQALTIGRIASSWAPSASLEPLLYLGLLPVFVLLIMDVIYIFSPLVYTLNGRRLRAAARRDSRLTPPVTFQPQANLALRDGETLQLARVRGVWSMIASGAKALAVTAAMVAVGEALLIALIPSLGASTLNPINALAPVGEVTPLANIALIDWVCVALPPLMGGRLLVDVAVEEVGARRDIVTADDVGLTRVNGWGRRRFIPWNDILVFMRGADTVVDVPTGGYLIWGQSHGLWLQIHERRAGIEPPEASTKKQARKPRADPYKFPGGYDAYERDARRLLATIAARSYQPLTHLASATNLLSRLRRRWPIATMDLESALALPLAAESLQPSEVAVADARQAPPPVFRLAPQFIDNWLPALAEIFAVTAILGGGAYLLVQVTTPALEPSRIGAGDLVALIGLGVILLICGALAVGIALGRRQASLPGVRVTATGLIPFPGNTQAREPQEARWEDIRAWAVLPAAVEVKRPAMYVVLTEQRKIVWVEPERARLYGRGIHGDREAAFRERAAELHALIRARTGLPLRDASSHGVVAALARPAMEGWGVGRAHER